MDRLVSAGFVTREPDPEDGRGAIVALTGQGAEVFDACAPLHLANERRLLATLTDEDQQLLANLLRELLASLERPAGERDATHWGMTLAPAHIALQMRRDVGMPERPGLLVRAIDAATPVVAAGIRQGDLLVAANGEALRSLVDLYDAIHQDGARTIGLRLVRGVRDREVVLGLPHPGQLVSVGRQLGLARSELDPLQLFALRVAAEAQDQQFRPALLLVVRSERQLGSIGDTPIHREAGVLHCPSR